jgi:hypothetical protein
VVAAGERGELEVTEDVVVVEELEMEKSMLEEIQRYLRRNLDLRVVLVLIYLLRPTLMVVVVVELAVWVVPQVLQVVRLGRGVLV